jgi:hypothetical protein
MNQLITTTTTTTSAGVRRVTHVIDSVTSHTIPYGDVEGCSPYLSSAPAGDHGPPSLILPQGDKSADGKAGLTTEAKNI